MRYPITVFALAALCGCSARPTDSTGPGVRVSFLCDTNVLADTCRQLSQIGRPPDSIAVFRKAVLQHNTSDLGLNLSRFPKRQDGLYGFKSCQDFAVALSQRLWEAKHDPGLACFDLVFLCLRDSTFSCRLSTESTNRPYIVPFRPTWESELILTGVTSRAEAFASVCPPSYTSAVQRVLGMSFPETHIALTVCLKQYQILSRRYASEEENLSDKIMAERLQFWKTEGVSFPEQTQVVLFHTADLKRRTVLASHAGLLVPLETGGWMYLEKAGCRGPFLRIDVADPKELLHRFALFESRFPDWPDVHHFLSINDRVLGTVKPMRLENAEPEN